MTRRALHLAILLLAVLFGAGPTASSGTAHAGSTDERLLSMEELEVHGRRDKPDELYLPVAEGIRHPAPVRFDLFREDMTRPILPGEINGPIQP